jgi:hypothetical protein
MKSLIVLGAIAVLALGTVPCQAVSPITWKTAGKDWQAVDRDSVGVASDGKIRLARAVEPIKDLEASVIWSLLRDGDGVLAATGDSGKLFRVDAKGGVTEVGKVLEPEVTALGRDSSGRVLAGASPDGAIYRLGAKGLTQVADTPENYVWAFASDGHGGTLIATGNAGKVYRLNAKGELALLADLGTTHVTGIEPFDTGFVLTTDTPGRLVALSAEGQSRVLYDGDDPELRSPVAVKGGAIYFVSNPASGSGRVLRRDPSGAVDPVWSVPTGFAYAMVQGQDGVLWVTTGGEKGPGTLVRLVTESPVSWVESAKLPENQVLAVLLSGGETGFLGTSGPGRLYRLAGEGSFPGRARSSVRDAGGPARWGALTIQPPPRAEAVTVETRSGSTKEPGSTWSEWQTVSMSGDRGPIASPPNRYLQWRLTLHSPQAEVRSVEASYLPANRGPRVESVQVSDLGAPLLKPAGAGPPGSLAQALPGGVRVEFQLPPGRSEVEAQDEEAAWARRYRSVSWDANDPNGDTLRYELDLRSLGKTSWKPIKKDVASSPWVWDSATVPDGWYEVQVKASDRLDNPAGMGLDANRVSDPFAVDNTPPRISDLRFAGGKIFGTAEDTSSPVKRIELSLDGGSWQQIFPEDGIADLPRETFSVAVSALLESRNGTPTLGDHVAMVRAFDVAGNPGTGRIEFKAP